MLNRKLYIFTGNTRASAYGIGTYVMQLVECLKGTDIDFGVVEVYTKGDEVTVTEKDGYQYISIPSVTFSGRESSKYYARNIAYLLKEYIKEEKGVEYIFQLNFMGDAVLAGSLKKMFKCKIILVAHYTRWGFSLSGDYSRLKQILAKKTSQRNNTEKTVAAGVREDAQMIAKCDKLVCVARHSLQSFLELYHLDKSKVLLVNNALKDSYIPMSEGEKQIIRFQYHFSADESILLFVGRLDAAKGLSYLIQAFRVVLKTRPTTRLVIAGEGDFNYWLKEAKDIWAQITFTGRIDKETLYRLYNIADAGVVCSIHEEFGLVAIEMMMHQLPVIVTDSGGLSEIVEDGVSGLKVSLIKEEDTLKVDVDKLASKIELLLEQPVYAKAIGVNGRVRFLENYELSKFKHEMLALYNMI